LFKKISLFYQQDYFIITKNTKIIFTFSFKISGGTQAGCMDLSSGPRASSASINEAQDFSMPFKNKPVQNITQTSSSTPPKSKLDDMLNKLMQKKNCVRTPRVSFSNSEMINIDL